jgi:MOSC domain-containing protein
MLAGRRAIPQEGMMQSPATIARIYRYPVKGLSPEPLDRTALAPGQTLPLDRAYAIENGPSGFDPAAPAYFPKQRFLMLMRNERLASLSAQLDEATHRLTIRQGGSTVAQGDLRNVPGRAAIEQFFASFCSEDLRGPPKVLHASGHSFSDVARKVVSIINLASVAEIGDIIGAPVDPLRFRANLYVDGWPAWREFELLDQVLAIGSSVRLKPVKRIVRCAATNVDPATGARDLAIPATLMQRYGHADCGIYAEVIAGGPIAAGDSIGPI